MSRPLISVCIPNYNGEKYLGQAVESALNQDYPHLEVLVSDGGSTDSSLDLLKKYDGCIKVISNPRRISQSTGTNQVVDASSGQYALILHSDDLLAPGALSALAPWLNKYPEATAAFGELNYLRGQEPLLEVVPFYSRDCLLSGVDALRQTLTHHCFRILFRRLAWDSMGALDEKYIGAQDAQIWIKLCAVYGRDTRIGYVRRVVGTCREHDESAGAVDFQKFYACLELACLFEDLLQYVESRCGLSPEEKAALDAAGSRPFIYLAHRYFLQGQAREAWRTLILLRSLMPDWPLDHEYRKLLFCAETPVREAGELYAQLFPQGRQPKCRGRVSQDPPTMAG